MIVLWGLSGDKPFELVREALARRGADVALIDQRLVLETLVELSVGPTLEAAVTIGSETLDLSAAKAVYWRTYDLTRLPAVVSAGTEDAVRTGAAIEDALVTWLELTPALVVNRPSCMASNGSKPFQVEIIRQHGFAVPPTLIANDASAIRRFWVERGALIYKSLSGVRSVVSQLRNSHDRRLDDVAACPTQFQQYIPGRDYRVHVVGEQTFATAITSDADDYRYAALRDAAPTLSAATIPDEVAERCVALSRSLGCAVTGVDLRLAPDGRWFCFEANPSPGFSYYQSHTGQPIADAIAALLMRAE
jgi:glutathione synthase/RimK-type ligase-like ATP-grasp enzyme